MQRAARITAATFLLFFVSPSVSLAQSRVVVNDRNGDGDYDQDDIDLALAICGLGCELKFLPGAVYDDVALEIGAFPDGIAIFSSASNPATLRQTVYTDPQAIWEPVIEVLKDAPDDIVIHDLILDGRKSEQHPFDDFTMWSYATGIKVGNPQGDPSLDGEVYNLTIRNFVGRGLHLKDAPGWSIHDNVISHFGCHQVDEPCGEDIPGDNPWDAVDDDSAVPDRKVPGLGVLVLQHSPDVRVYSNSVSNVTKIGIEVFVPDPEVVNNPDLACNEPYSTEDVLIEGNLVSESQTGYAVVGGCRITFLMNVASGMRVTTGGQSPDLFNVGNGFICSRDGQGSAWIMNQSVGNQRAGYNFSCKGGDIQFSSNTSSDNCQTSSLNAADMKLQASSGPGTQSGLDVLSPIIENSQCDYGLMIRSWMDVVVDGGSIASIADGQTAGFVAALNLSSGSDGLENVAVKNLSLTGDGVAGTNDSGIRFESGGSDSNVLVHETTTTSGFDFDARYYGGIYAGDGDSVGYCGNESPEPIGCP